MDRRATAVLSLMISTLRGACTPLVNSLRTHAVVRPRPYRPERYYMRGPGPKCREKHALGRIDAR
jgi:hypothetical protein